MGLAVIKLDMYQALAVAALMLVIGQVLVNKIPFLKRYCIPAPVVGGLIFAIAHTILRGVGILEFEMDTTLQTVFMTAFFCSVGFLAAFGMLKKGGIGVIKFLLLAVVMVALQDVVGGFGAKLFGLDGRLGLAMGSIPLVGGHGTTLLFVSHSIDQVERVCDKAVWIEKGHMRMIGNVKDVCKAYRHLGEE